MLCPTIILILAIFSCFVVSDKVSDNSSAPFPPTEPLSHQCHFIGTRGPCFFIPRFIILGHDTSSMKEDSSCPLTRVSLQSLGTLCWSCFITYLEVLVWV